MLDAPCFKRNFCRAQQCLAQITVVVGTGRSLHLEELTMLSPILQHVVINNNAGYAYIPRHPANRKHHPLYRHRSKDRLKRFTLSAITSSSRDPSSEPGCSRDQEQRRRDEDGCDGWCDARTG